FIFPLNASRAFDTIWACVHQCPDWTVTTYKEIYELAVDHNNSLCVDYDSALNITVHKPRFGVCPRLPCRYHESLSTRRISSVLEKIFSMLEIDFIRGFFHDLIDTSPYLPQMCLLALVLSLFSVVLLRFFAAVIIYFVYLAVVVISLGFSGTLWYAFYRVYKNSVESTNSTDVVELGNTTALLSSSPQRLTKAVLFEDVRLDALFNFEDTSLLTLLGVGLGATAISIFVISIVWCVLPRGKKMVRLFKGASLALSSMPMLLLQPLLNAVLILMVAVYTLSVVLVLFTAGDMVSRRVANGDSKEDSILIIETNMTRTTKLMMFYQFVGFVWVTEFFMACQRLFVAGAVSMYYFDVLSISRRFASPTPRSPLSGSLWNLFRYHLGSAALGAFIITLVRVPRYIVIWTLARMRSVENVVLKKILAVFVCILGGIERCLQYINYNVFTVISYSGFSFCPAAK
ncbi:hypothetical protein COOONC_12776, partial [Cooperia oncophora]